MKRIVKNVIIGFVSVLVLILMISGGSFVYYEVKASNESDRIHQLTSVQSFTKEDVVNELNNYQKMLEQTHPNPYHSATKEQFESYKNIVIDNLPDNCDRTTIYLSLSELSHVLMDEHVCVDIPDEIEETIEVSGKELFPLICDYSESDIVVIKSSNAAIPIGSKIIRVNGEKINNILDELSKYRSGRRTEQINTYVIDDFAELFFLKFGGMESFDITYRYKDEEKVATAESIDYKAYLKDKMLSNAFTFSDDKKTAYFSFNAFGEINPNNSLNQIIDDLFKEIALNESNQLVIDISRNKGGNSQFGDQLLTYLSLKPFRQMTASEMKVSKISKESVLSYIPNYVRWLPLQHIIPMTRPLFSQEEGTTFQISFEDIQPISEDKRFNGSVILKIGPRTMSSASLFAGTYKQLGIGEIVGEPTGGFPQHYGNVFDAVLPITGMTVQFPTSINYGNGGEQPVDSINH